MQDDLRPGATLTDTGARFTVYAPRADHMWLCTAGDQVEDRQEMLRSHEHEGWWQLEVEGLGDGTRYGYRAEGAYDPEAGTWFDFSKLLVDPWAVELDRPYSYDPSMGIEGMDTGERTPYSILRAPMEPLDLAPLFQPGGLIYETNVKGYTATHPDVPEDIRGTVAALAHPSVIDHLKAMHIDAIELMPITAWIDERHLGPLGLSNFWGYNPVTFMALDPRLCPGGVAELRETVAKLREAGIGVLLDLVFNHTGEGDNGGPTVSFRGLANEEYYRHIDGVMINDSGCGNTVACDHPVIRRMIVDSLRHFLTQTGVDGFRFDLGPILGRTAEGYDPQAQTLRAMIDDPVIGKSVLIAEPWDIGPGGYQVGNFPEPFLEWSDRYRDDLRAFWQGQPHKMGVLATRMAGSSDTFPGDRTRVVNFIAAHDGYTLWDTTAYVEKHNAANGEDNRDGHNDNLSWNNGVEGVTDDEAVNAARRRDVAAMIGTLLASRGSVMLTAGDEFGRTQGGNNNAYCQDNEIGWVDWQGLDPELLAQSQAYARARAETPELRDVARLSDDEVDWCRPDGSPKQDEDWHDARAMRKAMETVIIDMNGADAPITFTPPDGGWRSLNGWNGEMPARSVDYWIKDET